MKNTAMESRLGTEVEGFIRRRRSLQLATIGQDGAPYASYAPFALGIDCFYVLLSEIAVHGVNLQHEPRASVLILEDEDTAEELFARVRVNYSVRAKALSYGSTAWQEALACLMARHGERPGNLSELQDFKLFRLSPTGGRYIKGFGSAYTLAGNTFSGRAIDQLREGHRPRTGVVDVQAG